MAWTGPNPKPAKGTALIARRDRRKILDAYETVEKRKVRLRDQFCRWPSCDYCSRYKHLTLHVAHVNDKGMGGDHGLRSTADQMILLCALRHAGPTSLHSGHCRITPITDRGTDGPCQYEMADESGWKIVHCEEERTR